MTGPKYMLGQRRNGLYQLIALRSFGLVRAGELGGFVAGPQTLSQDGLAWVHSTAQVSDAARVYGNAQVFHNARLYHNAHAYDNARISNDAQVYGEARCYGEAQVYGNAQIYGAARVCGYLHVHSHARVGGVFASARRSDGWEFALLACADGTRRIFAGCRSLSLRAARAHWRRTRGNSRLGRESQEIITYLIRMNRIAQYRRDR